MNADPAPTQKGRSRLLHPVEPGSLVVGAEEAFPGEAVVLRAAERSLSGERKGIGRYTPFLGPAFIASVAYVDPGNFATNMAGGAKFGYLLLWVVLAANLMAMLIQSMSAKLGIATGMNLPEVCRDQFSRRVTFGLWVQAELIAMATDIAEFVGAAIGINFLTGLPLFPAALLVGVAAFFILGFRVAASAGSRWSWRCSSGVIVIAFGFQMFRSGPSWPGVGHGLLIPGFDGTESVLLAVGILGATCMPHVIYLHSALTQRHRRHDACRTQENLPLRDGGRGHRDDDRGSHQHEHADYRSGGLPFTRARRCRRRPQRRLRRPRPYVGSSAAAMFGIALLASGLSSSSVGTMAGQVVMQGFIQRQIPLWLRRTITMIPALIIIAIGVNPSKALILSQVVLSFGIPFALIPLVMFCRNRALMGRSSTAGPLRWQRSS